jgi:outer membrane protein
MTSLRLLFLLVFFHSNRLLTAFRSLIGSLVIFSLLVAAPRVKAQEMESEPPLLTLQEAIQLGIANNRTLRVATLEVEKSKWEIAEFKTKRLPSFSGSILGSELLNELSFTFKEGAFGNFPSTGPIPNKDTKITTPQRPTALVVSQITQPLSQLYKIHLGLQAQQISWQLDSEKARAQRQAVIGDVKKAYFAVLQSESAYQAEAASVKHYKELDRVVLQRVSQEAALQSESLEVKAKLANEQYKLVQLQNALDSRKEYLNDLMGRDIRTDFRTEQVPPAAPEEVELRTAQGRALAQRPEIKQAELSRKQAEYARRSAKADYIPDLGLAFNYLSPFNVDVLPKNVASIGLELKWEPWDWGRRKDVIAEKKVVETQAEMQLHDAQSKVLMDVNSHFRKLQESRLLIAVSESARDAAQQKLREVTNKYQEHSVLLRDVFEQQAASASALDTYQQALLGFWSAKADFEKSLGEEQ